MAEYQDTFKRYEKKYLLSQKQYEQLTQKLKGKMVPDQFANSTILNIYYDTPDYRLIRASLEKPIYKEKLRLRSYGVPSYNDEAFIELKKKYKGVVYKRRVGMNLSDADGYLDGLGKTEKEDQILKEIDWFLRFYKKISPAMFISYDRIAMYSRENPDLRLTFDCHITYRSYDLDLTKGIYGTELLDPGQRLLEIKIPEVMPIWMSHILTGCKIYPVSFSKYGKAYAEMAQRENIKKGEVQYA